jgi:hypothetical protein
MVRKKGLGLLTDLPLGGSQNRWQPSTFSRIHEKKDNVVVIK